MNFRSKTCFTAILLFLGFSLNAYANPQGANVVAGSATFTTTPNTLTINTASNKTIIDYNSFSIAANESTIINQPSSSSSVLNRVVGVDPSDIYGTLSSNGQLFLVNPNGIIFGPNSKVNAPAVLASTLDISNNDFLNGNYNFVKNGGGSYIINQGRLAATPGGYIALLSQAVNNQGIIIAPLGTVALAAGEKMTLALDSQSLISVVVDDAVKTEVLGPNGQKINNAVQNSGTITANGGKVLLTTKILNDVFDNAVNNSGVIEAGSLQNNNGAVELVASGAPIVNTGKIKASQVNISDSDSSFTNTGTIQANQINISVSEAVLLNQGQIISQYAASISNSGNAYINGLDVQQDGLIAADNTIDITADDVSTTIPFQSTIPTPVIKANQVNITANNLGASGLPIAIDASNIILTKNSGNINIAGSQPIGSNVMITGPPGGFGSIIYNPDTNLTLQANSGSINLGEGATLVANDLTLESQDGIYSTGSLIIPNTLTLVSAGDIYSLGVLESSSLFERGNTFQVGGVFNPGDADVKNADNALVYSANTNVSGTITDSSNIIVDAGVTLTMTAATSFQAGNAFTMNTTSTIAGGGYNLSISAKNASTIDVINNVNLLTLSLGSGSGVTFTANGNITAANLVIGSNTTLNAGSNTITLKGTSGTLLTKTGTFTQGTSTVDVTAGANVTLNSGNISFYNLTINSPGDNITSSGTISDTTLNLTGGTFTLGGTLTSPGVTISSGATLAAGTNTVTSTGTFSNSGTLTTTGTGSNLGITGTNLGNVTFSSTASSLPNKTYTTLTLANGGTSSGAITATTLNLTGGTLTINGTLTLANGGTTSGTVSDTTLNLTGGTFTLGGTLTSPGVTISSGATLAAGTNTVTSTGTFSNSGTLTTSGTGSNLTITGTNLGNVTFSSTASSLPSKTYGTLTLANGGTSSGAITDTTLNLTGGTFTLGGTLTSPGVTISSGATLAAGTKTVTSTGTFSNSGTLTTSGTGSNLGITGTNLGNVTFSSTASSLPSKTYGTLTLANGGTSSGAITDTTLNLTGGTLTLGGALTSASLTNSSIINLNGKTLTVTGTLTNNGTLQLIGSETTSISSFVDNGTTDYLGSGTYTISPLGTYNNLQFDNGTFTLGGSGTFTANGNVTIDSNVNLDLSANSSLTAGNTFNMNPTASIAGGGHNLSISALNASTLGNINNVNLLTLSLVSGTTPVTFTSNSSSTFQVNTVQTNYGSVLSRSVGTGTSTNPIMIYSDSNAPGGLEYIPTSGLGLYYQQANNINANETSSWNSGAGFLPIGSNYYSPYTAFTGSYNGENFGISNLYINNTTNGAMGLFADTSSTAVLSNINLTGANITGAAYLGGLVGDNYGSIANSSISGSVSGLTFVGGLVGYNYGSISNSYNTGSVSGTGSGEVGGLVGSNNGGSINSSYNTGNVTGSGNLGGLVGVSWGGPIANSYNTGNVTGSNSDYVGGLMGQNESSTINNSYSTGNVNGYTFTGGLVGYNYGSISNSYSTGSVGESVSGGSYIGGLVGINYAAISNSYSTGSVSGNGTGDVGGLAGENQSGSITNSFTTGNVTGSGTGFGGLTGSNSGTITNSYFTDNAYGSAGGTYETGGAAAFNSSANPVYAIGSPGGWGISTTGWSFSGGLPVLTYQISSASYDWVGTTSTNWSTASNWLGGVVPGSGANIFIYSGTYNPVLPSNISSSNVTIEPGAVLSPSTYILTGTNLIDYGTLMVVASTFAGNYAFTTTTLEPGSTVNYSGTSQTISNTLPYYNLTTTGSGTQTLSGSTTVSSSLINNATLNLNGQSLTVTGTLTNNGTLQLIGSETPSIGTFADNGTTDYLGGGAYTITPLGTYNNLKFDNGTFALGGTGTFTANGSITIDSNVNLYLTANTNLIAKNVLNMNSTASLFGNEYNLSLSALLTSTLGNVYNVNLLSFSLVFGTNPVTFTSNSSSVFQANTVQTNYGSILSRSVGTGTSANPIMIYSDSNAPGGLEYIPTSGLGLYYQQANNINANETSSWNNGAGFVPIGNASTPFTGSFNGVYYTISNLLINTPSNSNVGLFGDTSSTAALSNILLINGNVSGGAYVGSLVGFNNGGSISTSYSNENISGGSYVGGLVGNNIGSISNSYAAGNVSGSGNYVGGLVGENDLGSILDSYSSGNVNGSGYTGGLTGWNNGTITNSFTIGNVTGSGSNFGGLSGYNNGTITNSYFTDNAYGSTGGGTYETGGASAFSSSSNPVYALNTSTAWILGTTISGPGLINWVLGGVYSLPELWGYALSVVLALAIEQNDTYFWTGNGNSQQWNNSLNWTQALTGENVVPPTTNSIIIIEPAGYNYPILPNSNYLPLFLEILPNATLDPSTYNIFSSILISFGTLKVGASTFPNNYAYPILYLANNSTVNYYGNTQTIDSALSYYNLTTSGNGTQTLNGTTTVSSNLINDATLNLNGQSLTVTGTLTNNGTLQLEGSETPSIGSFIDDGTTIYNGNSSYNISRLGIYNNIDFENGTFTFNTFFVVKNNLTIQSGTLNADGFNIIVGGSWDNAGTFTDTNTGTVTLTGAGSITSGSSSFSNLTINATGTYTTNDGISTTGNFTQSSGNFTANDDFTTTGNFTQTSGTFVTNPSAIASFTVDGNFSLTGGNFISNPTETTTFTVDGNFSLTGGQFNRFTGSGTTASPYLIYDVYGLQGVEGYLSSSYVFDLNNSINAISTSNWNSGAGFVPIGNANTPFTGSFNGEDYTISNLTINLPNNDNVGLLGYTSSTASLSNIHLNLINISGFSEIGGLVGYNEGSISNSTSNGNVSSVSDDTGGLVGYNGGSGSINTSNSSVIVNNGVAYGGGLVGANVGIISNSSASGQVNSNDYSGGLAGGNFGIISGSSATGNVICTEAYIGGLVGYNSGTINNNSYSTGNVSGNFDVGGFVGVNSGAISNSYTTTSSVIGGVSGGEYSGTAIGGFVGYNNFGSILNSAWDVLSIPLVGYDAVTNNSILTFAASTNPNVTGTDL